MMSLSLRAALAELERFRGARPVRAFASSGWEIRLVLDNGQDLVIVLHPEHNALYAAPHAAEREGTESPLTRSLARNLAVARFAGGAQAGLDRVAALLFEGRDRLGDPRTHQIVLELTGKGANLVLLEGAEPLQGRVLDRLRPDRSQARPRRLTGGSAYELPRSGKADLAREGTAPLVEALRRARSAGATGAGALLEAWEGAGPAVAEILWTEALASGDTGEEALAARWETFARETAPASGGRPAGPRFAPCVMTGAAGLPIALAFRPAGGGDSGSVTPCATMLDAIAAAHLAFTRRADRERGSALPRALRRAREKTGRALEALGREAAEDSEAERLRRSAEAILAAAASLPRGTRSVEIPDPRTGEPMTVRLNPAFGPAENADLYFKKARKSGRAGSRIDARAEELRANAAALDALAERLGRFPGGEPDAAWLAEARDLGVTLPAEHAEKMKTGTPEEELGAALRPRRYDLGGGWEILVGKSDRGNHVLTFELSRAGDTWMHAEGCPGSHVVLRHAEKGKEPPRDVLVRAAAIAAFFSKARNAGKVPVTVADRRHVRRPRKAPVGQALVGEHRTIMVAPFDPEERNAT